MHLGLEAEVQGPRDELANHIHHQVVHGHRRSLTGSFLPPSPNRRTHTLGDRCLLRMTFRAADHAQVEGVLGVLPHKYSNTLGCVMSVCCSAGYTRTPSMMLKGRSDGSSAPVGTIRVSLKPAAVKRVLEFRPLSAYGLPKPTQMSPVRRPVIL